MAVTAARRGGSQDGANDGSGKNLASRDTSVPAKGASGWSPGAGTVADCSDRVAEGLPAPGPGGRIDEPGEE